MLTSAEIRAQFLSFFREHRERFDPGERMELVKELMRLVGLDNRYLRWLVMLAVLAVGIYFLDIFFT